MTKVQLFVYDLSMGLARQMSMAYMGTQVDAIYHTSVVVFNTEWWFGGGISNSRPYSSPHGRPIEVVDMGETHIDADTFTDYLNELRNVWTADKYHLLNNNCNNFTDTVCQFLVGKGIPSRITSLPSTFMNSPLGRQLTPMINQMFGQGYRQNSAEEMSVESVDVLTKQAVKINSAQQNKQLIVFSEGNAQAIGGKVKSGLAESPASIAVVDKLVSVTKGGSTIKVETSQILQLLQLCQPEVKFALYDLLRLYIAKSGSTHIDLTPVLEMAIKDVSCKNLTTLAMILRLCANVVASSQNTNQSIQTVITRIVTQTLQGLQNDFGSLRLSEALSAALFNLCHTDPSNDEDLTMELITACIHSLNTLVLVDFKTRSLNDLHISTVNYIRMIEGLENYFRYLSPQVKELGSVLAAELFQNWHLDQIDCRDGDIRTLQLRIEDMYNTLTVIKK
ncbi:hypothetical protein MP228_008685 [Amoeboaphelidium protococcarum]|nr:hypothetical protein MP228_008685 [Amoeboaphelidium protococcarum]